ncbi:MAG: NAD(P)H-hydrate epimerase [Planctomycetota bacterium]
MKEKPASGLSEDALTTIALENSGRSAALWALECSRAAGGARPLVVAGQGMVGAAALVAARHLFNWGLEPVVRVVGMRERLRDRTSAALTLLERYGARFAELLNAEQARGTVDALEPGQPMVYGAAGDESSNRATEISDLVNESGSKREEARSVPFSVRLRTEPPPPGSVRVAVRAEARDRETMRLFDSTAIREYGMPSLGLMENAGYWAARALWTRLEDPSSARVAVLAGKGNNGGDGFVIARHLSWWGIGDVRVYLAGREDQLMDDARVNCEYLSAPGVPVIEIAEPEGAAARAAEIGAADWLADALLGTGLSGPVRGLSRELLEVACAVEKPVLAVDTPSGLDATDGRVHGIALPASVTVTFGVPKLGFTLGEGPRLVGEVLVAEISLPNRITGAEQEFAEG